MIAIDVVLLPPGEVMDKAIEINNPLEDPIVLNKNNCLPHITLFFGTAEQSEIANINNILEEIASSTPALKLTIFQINGEHSAFDIKKTPELKKLQTTIFQRLSCWFIFTIDA